MGSPSGTYKSALIAYIQQSARCTRYEKLYAEDYLYHKTINELEDIAKRWNKHHPMYAAYNLGIALAYWTEEANIDAINALPIDELFSLIGIDDGGAVDYEEDD